MRVSFAPVHPEHHPDSGRCATGLAPVFKKPVRSGFAAGHTRDRHILKVNITLQNGNETGT